MRCKQFVVMAKLDEVFSSHLHDLDDFVGG